MSLLGYAAAVFIAGFVVGVAGASVLRGFFNWFFDRIAGPTK